MILDAKPPRRVISARTVSPISVFSAFRLGWVIGPILGSGFQKPLANVCMHAVATTVTPLPAAYFGEKSALLTVAITVSNVF